MTTGIKDKSTPIGLTAEAVQEITVKGEVSDEPIAEETSPEASEKSED